MSTDGELTEPVRLEVLARLVEAGAAAAVLSSATADERRLAAALTGASAGRSVPDVPALAELLRLAGGAPSTAAFVVGLRQAFLIPDDSLPPPACEACAGAFADIYRRLALPGLSGDSGERAQAILHLLSRPLPTAAGRRSCPPLNRRVAAAAVSL